VGLPTLRLVRFSVGPWTLEGLAPGDWRKALEPLAVPPAGRSRAKGA